MDDDVMPTREEKRARERERILAAALGVFAEKRLAGATMSLIAQRAKVSEATLAGHFESKDSLFAEVLAPAGLEIVTPSIMRRFLGTSELPWDDAVDLLRTFFAHHVEFVRSNQRKVSPILREAILRPETFLRALARREGLYPRFVELVDDLKRRGELRRDLPPRTVLCLVLSVAWGYGLARAVLMPDAEWDDARQAWLLSSVLAQGFRAHRGRKHSTKRTPRSSSAGKTRPVAPDGRRRQAPAKGRKTGRHRDEKLGDRKRATTKTASRSSGRAPRATS